MQNEALREAQAALEASRDRFVDLYEFAPVGYITFDRTGHVLTANLTATNLLGVDRRQLIRQRFDRLLSAADVDRWHRLFMAAMADTRIRIDELEMRRGEQQVFQARIDCVRQPDGDGSSTLRVALGDITERKLAEEAVRLSRERLSLALEGGHLGTWHVDLLTAEASLSDVTLAYLGRPAGTAVTFESFIAMLHPDDMQRIRVAIETAVDVKGDYAEEYRVVWPDGSVHWIAASGRVFTAQDGTARRMEGVLGDITGRKAAEASLVEAKEAAEAADQAKGAFLANMSHELRTPLNAVVSLTHVLRPSARTAKELECLDTIDEAVRHLVQVISSILEFSKLEAGKPTFAEDPLDIERIIADVVAMMAHPARSKNLQLAVEAGALPANLLGDPTRLKQALLNYVANAVKFTLTGGITLRVRVEEEGVDSALLRFEVEDTGIGLDPDAIPKLFTAFEQVDTSVTRRYGGTGLGIAIVRRLAELMGGNAGVASTLGKGSTFWFTARLRKGEQRTARGGLPLDPSAEAALRRDYRGRRVLLAESHPSNRYAFTELMESAGLDVDAAVDGPDALQRAAGAHYDLVVMATQMSRLTGIETVRRLRQLPGYGDIPVIGFAANASEEEREQCLAAGMSDYLAKPVEAKACFAALLKWLPQPG